METEITKSKISQDLREQADMALDDWDYDLIRQVCADGAAAIDELNQRLIDQTAAGMERGRKDQEEIRRLNREINASQAREAKYANGLKAVQVLIDNSEGVSGLHLNGNIAPWNELCEGGRYEGWLLDYDEAFKMLTLPMDQLADAEDLAADLKYPQKEGA